MAPDEEICDQVVPKPEALRPFSGKVVAFDDAGAIQADGEDWDQLISKLTPQMVERLTLMYVPRSGVSLIA